MNTKVFFCEPTGQIRGWLRRFTYRDNAACPIHQAWGHDAHTRIFDSAPMAEEANDVADTTRYPKTDPRWPKACSCGYVFKDSDEWQFTTRRFFKRLDTGEIILQRDCERRDYKFPVGAMWDAGYLRDYPDDVGFDRRALHVMTPAGAWHIDSRASNCTSPCKYCGVAYKDHKTDNCSNPGQPDKHYTKGSYEDAKPHKCWVRHGDALTGNVHVDKGQPGESCQAGGGSIEQKGPPYYHGFLHNGHLTSC